MRDSSAMWKSCGIQGPINACAGLGVYYYLPRGEFEELFASSREAIAQEAANKDA